MVGSQHTKFTTKPVISSDEFVHRRCYLWAKHCFRCQCSRCESCDQSPSIREELVDAERRAVTCWRRLEKTLGVGGLLTPAELSLENLELHGGGSALCMQTLQLNFLRIKGTCVGQQLCFLEVGSGFGMRSSHVARKMKAP